MTKESSALKVGSEQQEHTNNQLKPDTMSASHASDAESRKSGEGRIGRKQTSKSTGPGQKKKAEEEKDKKNPFVAAPLLDRTYMAPQELDLFALETKSRKTIAQLVKPILSDMDTDRKKMAELQVKQDRIQERLRKIEYAVGLSNEKPQVFVDIENEFADLKVKIALDKTDNQYAVDLCNQKLMAQERDLMTYKAQI